MKGAVCSAAQKKQNKNRSDRFEEPPYVAEVCGYWRNFFKKFLKRERGCTDNVLEGVLLALNQSRLCVCELRAPNREVPDYVLCVFFSRLTTYSNYMCARLELNSKQGKLCLHIQQLCSVYVWKVCVLQRISKCASTLDNVLLIKEGVSV